MADRVQRHGWGDPGGIVELADLIDRHRSAFEYDWRARFSGLSVAVIGDEMSWGEAIRLTRILSSDPTSQVCVAINEWSYPFSREAIVLADLYDLQHTSKARRRPKPYFRPWRDRAAKRTRPDAGLTQAEIITALRKAGHTAELPARLAHLEAEAVADG